MAYDIDQVLDVFDKLADKVTSHLDIQFNKNRIKGTEYASVYSTLMNTILQLSIDTPIKELQVENSKKDLDVKTKQIEVNDSQIHLYQAETMHFNKQDKFIDKQMTQIDKDIEVKDRQIEGFNDRMKLDLFKSQLDSWSMMFSSGMLDTKPNIISNDEVSSLYNDIKAGI